MERKKPHFLVINRNEDERHSTILLKMTGPFQQIYVHAIKYPQRLGGKIILRLRTGFGVYYLMQKKQRTQTTRMDVFASVFFVPSFSRDNYDYNVGNAVIYSTLNRCL